MISKEANGLLEARLNWSRLINCFCLFLLFSVGLAYGGNFRAVPLAGGFFIIGMATGAFYALANFLTRIKKGNFDLVNVFLAAALGLFAVLVYLYSPFPAFSGRDEGSYANAAIYLAKNGSTDFSLPLLPYLKAEAAAHQSLNFPGFVIREGLLSSQFSPAYFVLQALFYKIAGLVESFFLLNILLLIGGLVGFYFFLNLNLSRFVAASGTVALGLNFLFLWFPRFSLSENLFFFLFANLLLFVGIKIKYGGVKEFIVPASLIAAVLPLTRPEGWWMFLLVVAGILVEALRGRINLGWRQSSLKDKFIEVSGLIVVGTGLLVILDQTLLRHLPVYLRLAKDWLNWADQGSNYQLVFQGKFDADNFWEIVYSFFPSLSKIVYFWKVEWIYGVLIFVLPAFLLFIVAILKKDWLFSVAERTLARVLFVLSLPSWMALFSPQISSDHPWMLRRFYPVVLPLSFWILILLASKLIKKMTNRQRQIWLAAFLALMFLPSLPATAYFLNVKENAGREKIFWQLGGIFKPRDYVFCERESSGDGWKMWAEPLSSILGVNSAYVYSPDNLIANKDLIRDNLASGGQNYLVVGSNSYWFEHELNKEYELVLDRELAFKNRELELKKNLVDFPLFSNKNHIVRIYRIVPN
jgi:hypothetical protein